MGLDWIGLAAYSLSDDPRRRTKVRLLAVGGLRTAGKRVSNEVKTNAPETDFRSSIQQRTGPFMLYVLQAATVLRNGWQLAQDETRILAGEAL